MTVAYKPKLLWITTPAPGCQRLASDLRRSGYRALALPVGRSSAGALRRAEAILQMVNGILVSEPADAREVAWTVSRLRWRGVLFCKSQECAEPLRECATTLVRIAVEPSEDALVQLVREHWRTLAAPREAHRAERRHSPRPHATVRRVTAIANDNRRLTAILSWSPGGGEDGDDLPPSAA